jgi:putative hemolysin
MAEVAFEIVIVLLLLLLNGVFSMSELAVVTARKVRLERKAEEGDRGAEAALAIATNPNVFLSTVQVGITLIGVLAGAFGGAGISERLASAFRGVSAVAPYADAMALGIVVSVITYLSVIIGELVPKQLALSQPERIASLVARPMRIVSRFASPLVSLLTGSTNLVFRLFGITASAEHGVTEHDIRALVEQGAESGAVQPAEFQIVENTFRLGDRLVATIMTPRLDVPWVDVSASAADLLTELTSTARGLGTPLLVCDGDVETVVGVTYVDDLLKRALSGAPLDLRLSLVEPLFVPTTMPVLRLLESFQRSRHKAAVILDEYGGVAGVVTIEDILEALVGELPQHGASTSLEVVRQPDGSWLIDGGTAVDELEALFDFDARSAAERRGVTTVAGLVVSALGHLPKVGEEVDISGARFTVMQLEGRRVAQLRVSLQAPTVKSAPTHERPGD